MRELPEGQVICPSCGHDNSVSVNQNMVLKEATTLQNCREKISPTGKEVVNNIVTVRPAFWLERE
ncbi:MAG: hypothetical protein IKP86_08015 [Anaerolineaceae bacterium]|nr:hypothetical protein [Anaerolineaceae bacterium]